MWQDRWQVDTQYVNYCWYIVNYSLHLHHETQITFITSLLQLGRMVLAGFFHRLFHRSRSIMVLPDGTREKPAGHSTLPMDIDSISSNKNGICRFFCYNCIDGYYRSILSRKNRGWNDKLLQIKECGNSWRCRLYPRFSDFNGCQHTTYTSR